LRHAGTDGSNPASSSSESGGEAAPKEPDRVYPLARLHCKDVRPGVLARARAVDESFLDGVFTVPGDGAINFAAVLTALKAADYRGWLVVEAELAAHPELRNLRLLDLNSAVACPQKHPDDRASAAFRIRLTSAGARAAR
jgi:hypothetical protein